MALTPVGAKHVGRMRPERIRWANWEIRLRQVFCLTVRSASGVATSRTSSTRLVAQPSSSASRAWRGRRGSDLDGQCPRRHWVRTLTNAGGRSPYGVSFKKASSPTSVGSTRATSCFTSRCVPAGRGTPVGRHGGAPLDARTDRADARGRRAGDSVGRGLGFDPGYRCLEGTLRGIAAPSYVGCGGSPATVSASLLDGSVNVDVSLHSRGCADVRPTME